MNKKRIIVNGFGSIEMVAFHAMEQLGEIEVICHLSWSKNLDDSLKKFPNCKIDDQWAHIKNGLARELPVEGAKYLTPDNLSAIAWAEPIAIDMMARLDSSKSTTYEERRNLYNYLVSHWFHLVDTLRPDVFYTREVPHEVSDFILFAICKYLNVKIALFNGTGIGGNRVFGSDYRQPWTLLQSQLLGNDGVNLTWDVIPELIRNSIHRVRESYDQGAPAYFKEGIVSQFNPKKYILSTLALWIFTIRAMLKRYAKRAFVFFVATANLFFGDLLSFRITEPLLKRAMKIAASDLAQVEFNSLNKVCNELAVTANTSQKYIYFCLNYQPELTTSPLGGIFSDQILALTLLSNSLPDDWLVYVKEHPGQLFKKNYYGYIARSRAFYKRIASLPGVQLILGDVDQFTLIDKAQCVATITGTSGWEAIVRGTPAIIFGDAWYQSAPNVFRVGNQMECDSAIEKISAPMQFEEVNLIRFVKSILDAGVIIDFGPHEARWGGREFDVGKNAQLFCELFRSKVLNDREFLSPEMVPLA
ncbi:capsular biosynthesis protein [Polynucleobacter paneuropaeus]|uniref:capsular biosynthesis protein n=1 Tax=Polynucleobacter paneuropaeus TaxID=2527775 RepID=UPI001BFEC190|nr:capsular biosynthesis protein [Polynucleobacter paneuropaeus]MBT8621885.1 hypothetical protein [Polynucleobacter paneuropaeus]